VGADMVSRTKKIMVLLILIFAEAGYILGTTGLGGFLFRFFSGGATREADLRSLLEHVGEAYVHEKGKWIRLDKPPYYENATLYVAQFQLVRHGDVVYGGELPIYDMSLSEGPVYLLLLDVSTSPLDVIRELNETAPDNTYLMFVKKTEADYSAVFAWLEDASLSLGRRFDLTQLPIKFDVINGKPVSMITEVT